MTIKVEVPSIGFRQLLNYCGNSLICGAVDETPVVGEWAEIYCENSGKLIAFGQISRITLEGGFKLKNFQPA